LCNEAGRDEAVERERGQIVEWVDGSSARRTEAIFERLRRHDRARNVSFSIPAVQRGGPALLFKKAHFHYASARDSGRGDLRT
jgi:hypothetical protein